MPSGQDLSGVADNGARRRHAGDVPPPPLPQPRAPSSVSRTQHNVQRRGGSATDGDLKGTDGHIFISET